MPEQIPDERTPEIKRATARIRLQELSEHIAYTARKLREDGFTQQAEALEMLRTPSFGDYPNVARIIHSLEV
jgi:hypothetical protein